jgi:nitroreductase
MTTDTESSTQTDGVGEFSAPVVPEGPRTPGTSIYDDGIPTRDELTTIDWLLETTRSNRKTLDLSRPVEPEVIEECLRLALQAPTAHNDQRWHWLVITDPEKRAFIADIYQRVWSQMTRGERRKVRRWQGATQDYDKIQDSANWLPEHLAEVPVFVIPCMVGPRHDNDMIVREWTKHMMNNAKYVGFEEPPSRLWLDGGYFASIYPAVWSFQLALRSRGLGSCLTVVHLAGEQYVAKKLGLPPTVTQTCLIPVAYTTKRVFQPAKRAPLESRMSWNAWSGVRP